VPEGGGFPPSGRFPSALNPDGGPEVTTFTPTALADIARIKNGSSKFAVDVYESREAFVMDADLPGVAKEDLTVQVVDGRLRISGIRRNPERVSFLRVFDLPEGVSNEPLQARLKDGVLTLKLPKPDRMRSRRIPVTADSNLTI
jgi:HSP20 family protein